MGAEVTEDARCCTVSPGTEGARGAAWAQALSVLGSGLLSAAACLWEESTAFSGAVADQDVQKPGCGDLDALIYESVWAGSAVWVRASRGRIVPAGCRPVLWGPSHCRVPADPQGCLCWALGLSIPVNPRAQLSLCRQGAPVPTQHLAPLSLLPSDLGTSFLSCAAGVTEFSAAWKLNWMRQVPAFSGTWLVLLGKQYCTTAPGTLWSSVSSGPAEAALPSTFNTCRLVMFLQMSKSVGALRPEAKRLLVRSCDEYKQLQWMYTDISLQHLSKRAVIQ